MTQMIIVGLSFLLITGYIARPKFTSWAHRQHKPIKVYVDEHTFVNIDNFEEFALAFLLAPNICTQCHKKRTHTALCIDCEQSKEEKEAKDKIESLGTIEISHYS